MFQKTKTSKILQGNKKGKDNHLVKTTICMKHLHVFTLEIGKENDDHSESSLMQMCETKKNQQFLSN